jgi:heat shock protein HtpX
MKLFQMSKRVSLFVIVNVLVLLTIKLVTTLLGVDQKMSAGNYNTLLIFCFAWGMGGAFISLSLSRVMAKAFQRVRVISPDSQDRNERALVQAVYSLSEKAGLEVMPEVGVYNSPEVNAFATGPTRNRSLVAVSTGLLQVMDRREVEGVLAHEVSHIANGDMVTMTLLQGVINAFVMFLARILAFVVSMAMQRRDDDRGYEHGGGFMQYILVFVFEMILSVLGFLVVSWFSRWREFRADAGGAALAGRASMISALMALGEIQRRHIQVPEESEAFQTLKISSQHSGLARLFASHPPLEERITRLQAAA